MADRSDKSTFPRFSVVISVYNSSSTLRYCLDNLVYQTYDNIEIIIVDKESTDDSKKIEREYEERFPNKVRVFDRPYSDSPAAGRNYGISVASADYIAFCDADDYYDVRSFEYLANFLDEEKTDYDLVCYGSTFLRKGKVTSINFFPPTKSKEKLILGEQPLGFWNKLFKKGLLQKVGGVFDSLLDDIGTIPLVFAQAKKIGFLHKALYYFEQDGGHSHRIYSCQLLDMIKSIEHVFDNLPAEYVEAFGVGSAMRIKSYIESNWVFKDIYIKWLKDHRHYFINNKYLKVRGHLYKAIVDYIENYNILIPPIVYINGFENPHLDEAKSADWFYNTQARIVVLDENTCDIDSDDKLRRAFQTGNYDYIAERTAVNNILKTGGFYIGKRIKYNHYINSLVIYDTVFSSMDDEAYSGDFFAGAPEAPLIKELNSTYLSDFYDHEFYPLSERIKNIMTVKFNMIGSFKHTELNGRSVCVTGIDETVLDLDNQKNIFTHVFNDENISDEYVLVTQSQLKLMNSVLNPNVRRNGSEKQQLEKARKELEEIKNSDSYKGAMRIKKFANTKFGKPFKKMFKWFLKKYRKHKYGIG